MTDPITGALLSGLDAVIEYLAAHVVTCLVPAFFIAGAIAVFIKKEAILKYFSPEAKKSVSYGIASISGVVLAVCSCTILPLFAGILKKGSGIGPATTFLYAGPAINILAIIYTASVLGWDIGIARAFFAITMSIAIGLIMATIFRSYDKEVTAIGKGFVSAAEEATRPKWVVPLFFVFLVLILVIGASALIPFSTRLAIVYLLTLAVAFLLIYYFERHEVTEWGYEIWDLTKKIFPILIAGPSWWGSSPTSSPLKPSSRSSAITRSVPVSWPRSSGHSSICPPSSKSPLSAARSGIPWGLLPGVPHSPSSFPGPAVSLPSLLVLYRIMGGKKTLVYALLVVGFSTLAGFVFGNFFPYLGIPGCGSSG